VASIRWATSYNQKGKQTKQQINFQDFMKVLMHLKDHCDSSPIKLPKHPIPYTALHCHPALGGQNSTFDLKKKFWWCCGLNSGPPTCHLSVPDFFALVCFSGRVLGFCLEPPLGHGPPTSASCVAGTTDV
jgi:hypothetical protein